MTTLQKLSAKQLNKLIDETQAELARRKNIDAAASEIRSTLKKYNVSIQDIDLNTVTKSDGKRIIKRRPKATKSQDQRRTVQPKYKDPNSTTTWTGRGRTPAWVQHICQNENIDIKKFKKDSRFRY